MVVFQALCWELQNKSPSLAGWRGNPSRAIKWGGSVEDSGKRQWDAETQIVHCTGRTAEGDAVRVAILGYHPYFYARVTEETLYEVLRNHTFKYGGEGTSKRRKNQFQDWWIAGLSTVRKRVYQGFKNGEDDLVLKVVAANQAVMRDMINALSDARTPGDRRYELFDDRQDVLCSFFHAYDIKPCGWLQVNDSLIIADEDPPFAFEPSRCEDYVTTVNDVAPVECTDMAPFLVCSLDIEAFALMDGAGKYPFPDPKIRTHEISCLCLRKRTVSSSIDAGEYVYFSYKPLDNTRLLELCAKEGLTVNHADSRACVSERDMLNEFVRYFSRCKFDIIIGWNTLNFDMRYIYERCAIHKIDVNAMAKWSPRAGDNRLAPPRLQDITLSTAGAGHNNFIFWHMPGVFQMDELVVVRRDKKYDSYKLGNVAERLLGDTKMDEPPDEIHRKSQGTPAELSEIVAYCMKDTLLPDAIATKLQSYMQCFMFSNIATVPVSYLLTRGANIKTSSFIFKHVRRRGMIISNARRSFNHLDGKYEGATVLDALKGFYNDPVSTLDFKSLYPSIFISQVLDPHSFVESETYLGLPGVKYKNFRWNDRKSNQQFNYWVVTNGEQFGCPAVIPDIMDELWKERDAAKKKMKRAETYMEKSVYDGIQLAIKLLMNSIYGFFGAVNSSPIPHLPLAMICTYTGRKFIEESQKFVLARYGDFDDDSTTEQRMSLSLTELTEKVPEKVVNVYGDTDSIFVKWTVSDEARSQGSTAILEENFKQSELAAEEITKWLIDHHCPRPVRVEMEFEKVYYSLISYSKKRYIGLLWTKTDRFDYIDYKGVQPVRRDTPKILKHTIQKCIELILIEKDRPAASQLLSDTFTRIERGDYEVREFAKTGAISDKEYVGALPPAAEVANHLRERGLDVPNRVEYVYIVGDPKAKASKKVESPDYIEQQHLKVDTRYYMTNQFKKPILELLGPALDGLEELINDYTNRFAHATEPDEARFRREAVQKELKTAPITSFFKRRT